VVPQKQRLSDCLKRMYDKSKLSEVHWQVVPDSQGPDALKARSGKLVHVRQTRSVRVSAERSLVGRASVTKQQSSSRGSWERVQTMPGRRGWRP